MHHNNNIFGVVLGLISGIFNFIFVEASVLNWTSALETVWIGALGAVGGFIATAMVKWIAAKARKIELQKILDRIKRNV